MYKKKFAKHLELASERIRENTRRHYAKDIPEASLYEINLNVSFDGNPLRKGEAFFSDHDEPQSDAGEFYTSAEVVDRLWRDGYIPEWIDIIPLGVRDDVCHYVLLCCGRFTATNKLLYHRQEGYPPFHCFGQILSWRDHDLEKNGKVVETIKNKVQSLTDMNAAPPVRTIPAVYMIIDDPPRKDLIPIIVNSANTQALREYFVSTVEWAMCENPRIRERRNVYCIFNDLLDRYLAPTISKSLFEYFLSDIEVQNSDEYFISSIYIMNKLKNRWQLDSLDEAQALLGRLMKYNDKALSLKHVDGDITGWFYQLIIFYQYAKISLIKYDEIAESAIYPSEMKDTIVKAHGAELEYVKAVSYHGCNFWIWRAFPHNSVAAYGSYHLWAIAGKKDGSFACYTYSTSPKFNIPSETIVARIEDADFIFGDLDEISLDQSGDIIYKTI